MTEVVQSALDLVARVLLSFLAAGCLVISAYMFARWLRTIVLRQLQRVALTVFLAAATTATIVAQKGDRGAGTTGVPPVVPPVGEATLSPLQEALTNTLRFADIVVHTNGTATLSIAWPSTLLPAAATLDLFAATSLVNAVWVWQCAHHVAAGETNWIATVALPQTSPGTNAPSAFFYVSNRETCADNMADSDGDGLPGVYELAHGTNPYVPDYASAPKLTVGQSGDFTDIQSALVASTDYSIIELDPSVRHEITDSFGVELPQYPVMLTASNSYAVVSPKTCTFGFHVAFFHRQVNAFV